MFRLARALARFVAPRVLLRAPTAALGLALQVLRGRTVAMVCGAAALLAGASGARGQVLFEPPIPSQGGLLAERILIGDVNEDGLPDAIVSHMQFLLLPVPGLALGLGDGSFAPPEAIPPLAVGARVRRLADFDADGHLDLLVVAGANLAPPANASVLPGLGDGSFGPPVSINGSFQSPIDADVGDFDGDGALDAVVMNGMHAFSAGSIVVALGNGDGSFEPPITAVASIGTIAGAVRTGDLDGDGLDDFVFTGASNGVRLSLGGGSFVAPPCSPCLTVTEPDLTVADLDLDGRDDVLTPLRSLRATPAGSLALVQALPATSTPASSGVGDLDGDGLPDAVIGRNVSPNLQVPGDPVGDVLALRGLGNGSFALPGVVVSHVPQPRALTVADVDLDGRLDVVAGSFLLQQTDTVRTLLNHSYGAGSPFLDLGYALSGSNGAPIQLAEGTLVAGEPFSFRLANGPAGGVAYHVVGVAQLAAAFKGGVMVPAPALVNGPLPLDAGGGITLAGPWPGGAEGLALWLQFWMPNAGGPKGFAASSGVRAQVP
jgi:hypothetical protein